MAKKIFFASWILFALLVMTDPSGQLLHLKEIGFVLMAFVSVFVSKFKIPKEPFVVFLQIFICAFLSVISVFIFRGADLLTSLSYFKALLFILFFVVISKVDYHIILRVNAIVGFFLSVIITGLFLAMTYGYLTYEQLSQTNTIAIAYRDFLGIPTLMFFYMTMPFVLFSFVYYLRKNNLIFATIIGFSIAIGGSRTPILCGLAILLYVFSSKSKKVFRYLLFIAGIGLLVYLISNLTSKEHLGEGDGIKFRLVHDLLYNSSIIPHGVGIPYWDASRKEMTSSTEMTYFEMLYQYGWVLFPFVLYLIVAPITKLRKYMHDTYIRDYVVAYSLYLINAGTNPLLFSSTGMYVFACALVIMSKRKNLSIVK